MNSVDDGKIDLILQFEVLFTIKSEEKNSAKKFELMAQQNRCMLKPVEESKVIFMCFRLMNYLKKLHERYGKNVIVQDQTNFLGLRETVTIK